MKKEDKIRIGMASVTVPSFALGLKLAKRGRRLRKLQSLIPKITTDSPKTFMDKLRPGDVILMGNDSNKFATKLNVKTFRLSEGDFFHTTMYIGDGKIAHLQGRGVGGIDPMSKYFNGKFPMLVVRPEASPAQIQSMVNDAKKNIHSYKRSWLYTGTALGGDTRFGRKIERSIFGNKVNKGTVLCSSTVANLQTRAGIKTPRAPQVMTSVDFRSMKKPPEIMFQPKGRKQFKTSKYQGVGFTIPAMVQAGYEYKRRK